jgi:lipopolysaccharide transport system ATP-binding protein
MANKLIEAENISKYYRLGVLGSRSLKEDLKNWWSGNLKKSLEPTDPESRRDIWALRDINFEVYQGEVLGLIGKNGAGKSTLLKIISRITLPTTGRISGNGRIASLLEVGTGFHGELTGRENIYLNGNIMGMKKKEIDRKFDEIIEFSGVSRFLDTPVKRYSSGMYVRLAFAVAAHLDPEILVIDEVLAVGDAEFQQKCMAKIKSISKEEGKTILFVSHNIQTIRNVCNRALVLEKGKIIASGESESVLASYVKLSRDQFLGNDYSQQNNLPGNNNIRIKRVELIPNYLNQLEVIDVRTELSIRFEFIYQVEEAGELMVILQVFRSTGELIFELASPNYTFRNGMVKGESAIPGNFLNDGLYYISLAYVRNSSTRLFYHESCLSFDVEDYKDSGGMYGKWAGIIRPSFPLKLDQEQGRI